MTPLEILCNMDRPLRTHRYWVDSSVYGDVIGGCRDILLTTHAQLKLQCSASGFSMGGKIDGQYLRLDLTAAEAPDGMRRTYTIPHNVGSVQEIITPTHHRERRALSRQRQLAAQSLDDIWQQELDLPNFVSTAHPPRLKDQIVICGGWKRWGMLGNQERVKEDAIGRPTPRELWEMMFREVVGNDFSEGRSGFDTTRNNGRMKF